MRIIYRVMVSVRCGHDAHDGFMNLEYSGVAHTKEERAKKEMEKARKMLANDPKVSYVWLDKVEVY